jgi:hypothetical protein
LIALHGIKKCDIKTHYAKTDNANLLDFMVHLIFYFVISDCTRQPGSTCYLALT